MEQLNYLEFVSGETFPFIVYLHDGDKPIVIPEIWSNAILEFKIKNSNYTHFNSDAVYIAYNMLETVPRAIDTKIIKVNSYPAMPLAENIQRLHTDGVTYKYYSFAGWKDYDYTIKFQINSWDSKKIAPSKYLFEANLISAEMNNDGTIKQEYFKVPIISNHILYVRGSLNA